MSQAPAWLVSMVLHVIVLLTMALIVTPTPERAGIKTIESPPTDYGKPEHPYLYQHLYQRHR